MRTASRRFRDAAIDYVENTRKGCCDALMSTCGCNQGSGEKCLYNDDRAAFADLFEPKKLEGTPGYWWADSNREARVLALLLASEVHK